MSKYKIRVKVELVECDDKEHGVIQEEKGCFSTIISEKDAISIDNCEKAVLQTSYPTIRDALSKHLSKVSKKRHLRKPKI
jgi:hypothetical protein